MVQQINKPNELSDELENYNSMELNLLMYTNKVNIALIFREQCLSGSISLQMLK